MALPAAIDQDAYDALNEVLKGEYTKDATTGRFRLDVTPVDGLTLENVSGLQGTVQKLTRGQKNLSTQLAQYGNVEVKPDSTIEFEPLFTPEQYQALSGELDETKKALEENDPKAKVTTAVETATARLRQELVTAHQAEKAELERNLNEANTTLRNTRGDFAIQGSISKKAPGAEAILMPLMRSVTGYDDQDKPFIKDPDHGGVRLVPSTGLPMTHDEYLDDLATQDQFKPIFPAQEAGGSGEGEPGAASGSPEQLPAGLSIID